MIQEMDRQFLEMNISLVEQAAKADQTLANLSTGSRNIACLNPDNEVRISP